MEAGQGTDSMELMVFFRSEINVRDKNNASAIATLARRRKSGSLLASNKGVRAAHDCAPGT